MLAGNTQDEAWSGCAGNTEQLRAMTDDVAGKRSHCSISGAFFQSISLCS